MEDTGKKGLGQKLKDKLHLGHSHKSSGGSDEYGNQGQVSLVARSLAVQAVNCHDSCCSGDEYQLRVGLLLAQQTRFRHSLNVSWPRFQQKAGSVVLLFRDLWDNQLLKPKAVSNPALLLECLLAKVQHLEAKAHSP